MSSLLRFALFAATLAIVLAAVAVPIGSSLVAGSLAHDISFGGNNVKVSVDLLGAELLSGVAPSVHVEADDIGVPHGTVGHLDMTVHDVSLSDHSFSSVDGTLSGVQIDAPGGPVTVDSVKVDGTSHHAHASGTLSAAQSKKLVKSVAQAAGVDVDSVQLGQGSVTLQSGGKRVNAALRVAGNALVLDQPGGPATVLIAPPPAEKWQITSVDVTPAGINVGLNVDVQDLAGTLERAASGN